MEQKEILPKKLNPKGSRTLAIAVIRAACSSAKESKDYSFFFSPLFHFYAGLAYGCKPDYKSEEDIVRAIENSTLLNDLRLGNRGSQSKWK